VSLQEKMNDRIRLTQTLQGEHEKMTRVIWSDMTTRYKEVILNQSDDYNTR
jgi:hypothetical protein